MEREVGNLEHSGKSLKPDPGRNYSYQRSDGMTIVNNMQKLKDSNSGLFQRIEGYVGGIIRDQNEFLNSCKTRGDATANPAYLALESVRTGCFTSLKDNQGHIRGDLSDEKKESLKKITRSFHQQVSERAERFAAEIGSSPDIEGKKLGFTLYRALETDSLKGLKIGDKVQEVLPYSTSWDLEMVKDWCAGRNGDCTIFKIETPVGYPMLVQAFPQSMMNDEYNAARPVEGSRTRTEANPFKPLNQGQGEVTLWASNQVVRNIQEKTYKIGSETKKFTIVTVSPEPLQLNEVIDAIDPRLADQRRENERQKSLIDTISGAKDLRDQFSALPTPDKSESQTYSAMQKLFGESSSLSKNSALKKILAAKPEDYNESMGKLISEIKKRGQN